MAAVAEAERLEKAEGGSVGTVRFGGRYRSDGTLANIRTRATVLRLLPDSVDPRDGDGYRARKGGRTEPFTTEEFLESMQEAGIGPQRLRIELTHTDMRLSRQRSHGRLCRSLTPEGAAVRRYGWMMLTAGLWGRISRRGIAPWWGW